MSQPTVHPLPTQPEFRTWNTLLHDRVWLGLFGLQALVALPFLAPSLLPGSWQDNYHVYLGDLALGATTLTACAITIWRSKAHTEARVFWRIVTATALIWFVADSLLFACPVFTTTVTGNSLMDCIYCGAYLLLILAAEIQPHRDPGWTRQNAPLAVRTLGSVVFVSGLCAYFVVVPYMHGDTAQDDDWRRSFLLFLLLDAFLLIRFLWLAYDSTNRRWRKLYGGFALLMAAILIADAVELEIESGLEPLGLVWFGQYVILTALARLGFAASQTPRAAPKTATNVQLLPLTEIMFVMMALLIPTIHVAVQQTGILDPNMIAMRERVAFLTLFTLGGLAILQAILLSRRNRSLMRDLETATAELVQAQKMEAVGRLAGGIAHDFNNLLTVIIGQQDRLHASLESDDPRRAAVEEIAASCDRASALTHQLLSFTKQRVRSTGIMDLDTVIADLDNMMQLLIGEDIELVVRRSDREPWIMADRHQIERLFLNLVVNARDAMPTGGNLVISTRIEHLDEDQAKAFHSTAGEHVVLEVSDSGCGMSQTVQEHIFEPFFTTKDSSSSTGLGLATVYGIVVEQTSGHIAVESRENAGTRFSIRFKRATAPTPEPQTEQLPPPPTGRESILLVEDEQAVRLVVKRALVKLGFEVVDAEDGSSALELARQDHRIDLLLTDVVMPGMSGAELANRLTESRPRLRVLYMSGYTGEALTDRGVHEEGAGFIQKPFTAHELGVRVRAVLDSPMA